MLRNLSSAVFKQKRFFSIKATAFELIPLPVEPQKDDILFSAVQIDSSMIETMQEDALLICLPNNRQGTYESLLKLVEYNDMKRVKILTEILDRAFNPLAELAIDHLITTMRHLEAGYLRSIGQHRNKYIKLLNQPLWKFSLKDTELFFRNSKMPWLKSVLTLESSHKMYDYGYCCHVMCAKDIENKMETLKENFDSLTDKNKMYYKLMKKHLPEVKEVLMIINGFNTYTSSSISPEGISVAGNETPQSFWLNKFLRRAAGMASFNGTETDFKAALVKDLAEAVEQFSVDKFRTDYYFLLIWLSYIKLQFELHGDEDDCRKMFKMMKSSHIGLHHPEFFLHWADFELKVDRRDKSLAVLSSSNETPIMRGNPQISEAKELIEAHKDLKLQSLYSINPSSSVKRPPTSTLLTDTLDEKLMKIKRGLGPPKRIKENDEKENSRSFITNSILNLNAVNVSNNNNTNNTDRSGNSNMSLTLTELNVNIIQNDKKANNSLETEPVTPFNDTGTYNLTNNTNNFNAAVTKATTSTNSMNHHSNNATSTARSRQVRVNGKIYRVLQLIGRGGSSKVFSVIDADGQIFALKKVNLKNLDEVTLASYTNEIALLKSFTNNPHIIQLVDSEMNQEQACLYILMEYGEVDLGKMLKKRVETGKVGEKVDENFVRFSFEQMLNAVNTVHEAKIVHCDLKPANFLLVQGTLKLIDFGISKAILNDTTNIVRENQVGTVNYMSPEALQETSISHDRTRLKIGRPSDIWSLGCILYEMTFGRPPFAQFTTLIQRLHKILDPGYEIEFPQEFPNSDLINAVKGCLRRPPKDRLTLPQLLQHALLKPSCLNAANQILVSKAQIHDLLERFAEAYPGIKPDLLTDRIFQQWKGGMK